MPILFVLPYLVGDWMLKLTAHVFLNSAIYFRYSSFVAMMNKNFGFNLCVICCEVLSFVKYEFVLLKSKLFLFLMYFVNGFSKIVWILTCNLEFVV